MCLLCGHSKRPVSDRHRADVGDVDDVVHSIIWHGVVLSVWGQSVLRCWALTHSSAWVLPVQSCTNPHVASLRLPCQDSNPRCLCLSSLSVSASKQFAEEVLQYHNEFRRRHQAPPLKLSNKLSREASRWVNAHANQIRNLISKDYPNQSLSDGSG